MNRNLNYIEALINYYSQFDNYIAIEIDNNIYQPIRKQNLVDEFTKIYLNKPF